jgi:hypothetical protein
VEARRGLVLQRWQVEHGLKLPILAVLPAGASATGQERRA